MSLRMLLVSIIVFVLASCRDAHTDSVVTQTGKKQVFENRSLARTADQKSYLFLHELEGNGLVSWSLSGGEAVIVDFQGRLSRWIRGTGLTKVGTDSSSRSLLLERSFMLSPVLSKNRVVVGEIKEAVLVVSLIELSSGQKEVLTTIKECLIPGWIDETHVVCFGDDLTEGSDPFSVSMNYIEYSKDSRLIQYFGNFELSSSNSISVEDIVALVHWDTIEIVDAKKGVLLQKIEGLESRVMSTSWREDGKMIAIGTCDGRLHVYDIGSKRIVYSRRIASKESENSKKGCFLPSISWRPGSLAEIAVSEFGAGLSIVEISDGKEVELVEGKEGIMGRVNWSPDGRRISLIKSQTMNENGADREFEEIAGDLGVEEWFYRDGKWEKYYATHGKFEFATAFSWSPDSKNSIYATNRSNSRKEPIVYVFSDGLKKEQIESNE